MTFADWIGSFGVFMILLAFALNITGKLSRHQLSYILLNLIGASLACLASFLINYVPFIILEGVWALVSAFALYKHYKS
ncbi:CBU_0592 family membrane protein [Muriicola soli]|uniref:CBU-0592-like domain-containing protein n=1 Tax=Muriicola soli TaxID=2507538 RepID=A0A411EBH5_9FLAO|nr:hypothetical protein [Muriicola soli]QBA65019.1 hypothetical protein EQY75_11075 [Muriicola soli]